MRDRPPVQAHLNFARHQAELRGIGRAELFTRIYRDNLWGGAESRSGLGSDLAETAGLRAAIPPLLRRLGASSLLDLPCGDFGWMRHADLRGIDYTGGDIVTELIERNAAQFAGAGRRFQRLDLVADALPRADVVLCRDCLVHLCFANIFAAFANLRRSGARHLLTTTFTEHGDNADAVDGDWRLLNLERAPFHLPAPLALIVEGCTEAGGAYADKALALWPIDALPSAPR